MDHPIDEKPRLVNSIVPTVPTWAVYYDESTDQLFTDPVLFFNVWEKAMSFKGEETRYSSIEPVPFCSEYRGYFGQMSKEVNKVWVFNTDLI